MFIVCGFAIGDFEIMERSDVRINNRTIFNELVTNEKDVSTFKMRLDKEIPRQNLTVRFDERIGHVEGYKIKIKTNCTKQIPVMGTRNVCHREMSCDNRTRLCRNINVCLNQSYPIRYNTEIYECWKEVNQLPSGNHEYKIEPTEIEIVLNNESPYDKCPNGDLMCYSIDWILNLSYEGINYLQPAWAWWNASYPYRMNVSCNNNDDFFSLVLNGTNDMLVNGSPQVAQTYCSGTGNAVYFSDYNNWVKTNDTHVTPMCIEKGNVSSFNCDGVWNNNELGVYFMNNVTDSTSNNNHGTNNGAVQVTGFIDGAFDFESSENDYIDFGDNLDYDFGISDFSISMLIKAESFGAGANAMVSKHNSAFNDAAGWTFEIYLGKLEFFRQGAAANLIQQTPALLNAGQWYLITLTVDYGTAIKIYINGSEAGSYDKTYTSWSTLSNTRDFQIGIVDGSARGFDGIIDDVKIYDRLLNSSEISKMYQNYQTVSGYGDLLEIESNEVPPVPPVTNNNTVAIVLDPKGTHIWRAP